VQDRCSRLFIDAAAPQETNRCRQPGKPFLLNGSSFRNRKKYCVRLVTEENMQRKEPAPVVELDMQTAIQRMGGHREIYYRILRFFAPEFGDAAEQIVHHLNVSDFRSAERLAHSTKGAAGNIGATVLAGIALSLEKAIAARDETIPHQLAALQKELASTVIAVSKLLEREDQAQGGPIGRQDDDQDQKGRKA
jgi:HPt (histidine-containing phosphotransfer) domain-containing protein